MKSECNNASLNNGHFSYVKRILKILERMDDELNLNKYDLNKIVSYYCRGYDLTGSSCYTRDSRRHFLVNNNNYMVYEIPKKSNKGLRMTGDYFCLIKNLDFGFWISCMMKHRIERAEYSVLEEKVTYTDIAELEVIEHDGLISVYCKESGQNCCRGYRTLIFDDDDNRKEKGYHTTKKVLYKSYGIKKL